MNKEVYKIIAIEAINGAIKLVQRTPIGAMQHRSESGFLIYPDAVLPYALFKYVAESNIRSIELARRLGQNRVKGFDTMDAYDYMETVAIGLSDKYFELLEDLNLHYKGESYQLTEEKFAVNTCRSMKEAAIDTLEAIREEVKNG